MTICKISLPALALLVCLAGTAAAQTKSETKAYGKALRKPSVAVFDKFLGKYPSSVYAADITARRDTLLSISPYGAQEAAEIFAATLPLSGEVSVIADRRDAVDRIYGIALTGDGLPLESVRIWSIVKGKSGWSPEGRYDAPSAPAEAMTAREFAGKASVLKIQGTAFLRFDYIMKSGDGSSARYVAAYYAPLTDEFGWAAFDGRPGADRIVGRVDESGLIGMQKPQMRLLVQSLKDNPLLEQVPDAEYFSDVAIEWWTEHNPEALTTAGRLSFNIIQEGSSLIEDFAAAKGKQNSARYRAALIDTRGYTVIVVYQKEDGNYVLAWAEPECKDHNRDRLLNSISFEGANTLVLSYYHGSRTFKYRINLASKTIRR